MLAALKVFTFLWLGFWALRSFKWLSRGSTNTIHLAMIALFVFTGIGPLLDVLLGMPSFKGYPGFYEATRDSTTSVVYCLYVCAVPFVLLLVGTVPARQKAEPDSRTLGDLATWRRRTPVLYLFLVAPLPVVLLAPDPSVYLTYGAMVLNLIPVEARDHHTLLSFLCMFSIVAAVCLLALRQRITISFILFLLPWMSLACWVRGKRNIILIAFFLLGYVLWQRGVLQGKRLVAASAAALVLLVAYSHIYQTRVREKTIERYSFDYLYQNVRFDYSRDAVIRIVLYAELHPERMQILDHRGQSFLFDATMYVPRSVWPEKPLPYAMYVTSAGFKASPRYWGWGLTTCFLEEAIANLSWFGLLVGPLVIAFVCRLGDGTRNPHARMLTGLIVCLLLAVHLPPFAPLLLIWMGLVSWDRWSRYRGRRRLVPPLRPRVGPQPQVSSPYP